MAFGAKVHAQASDTEKALLGNDPNTTLTTGIGQVVQPVGIPVIKSPLATYPTTSKQTPLTPTKPATAEKKIAKSKKEASLNLLLSNQIYGSSSSTGHETNHATAKVTRVPTTPFPKVQRIPYH